jgi:hypothetical protein
MLKIEKPTTAVFTDEEIIEIIFFKKKKCLNEIRQKMSIKTNDDVHQSALTNDSRHILIPGLELSGDPH